MAGATTQISSVTVPALVISLNGVLFTDGYNGYYGQEVIGKVLKVPCRDILYDNTDRWAIPIKDNGIFTGMDFEYKKGAYLLQPTYDSIPVFRITDTKSTFEWFIYGQSSDLIAACSTCCDDASIPMPGISPAFAIRIAPCETVNLVNGSGIPYMVFGIPSLLAGGVYFPYGSLNNVSFPPASATGYSSISSLLAFLNANYTPYVWTVSADNMTLTATGGVLGSSLCVEVISILPS